MTTQRAALKDTVKRLKESGIDTPVLDARLLLQFALDVDWAALFTGPDRDLTMDEAARIEILVQRRLAREPVSRIVGRRGFWKFDLAISPATLDPRPDTETLIMTVMKLVPDLSAPLAILDLGTGSGAILLALLHEMPQAHGIGIDISADSVATAAANALELGLHTRSDFVTRDWHEGVTGQFDIVVANPPYIPSGDIPGLAQEVRDYDPHIALNGGPDGLDAYRALAALVPTVLKPGGLLAVEIGIGQAEAVERLLATRGFDSFRRWKDLGDIERVITARLEV